MTALGGGGAGGAGGLAQGIISVQGGDILNVYVGGQNRFNGGGARSLNGADGAGASDVRKNGTAYVTSGSWTASDMRFNEAG